MASPNLFPPFSKGGKGDFLELGIWILPFDYAQGGELVEPFVICYLVLNAVNLANGLIGREEFSARSFMIAWIFSPRPNWLYCSLKNILKVGYQLANLCYGLVKKQSNDAFGF